MDVFDKGMIILFAADAGGILLLVIRGNDYILRLAVYQ